MSQPTLYRPALPVQIKHIDEVLGEIAKIRTEMSPEGFRDWAVWQRDRYIEQFDKNNFSTRDADEALKSLKGVRDDLRKVELKAIPEQATPAKPEFVRPNVPAGYYAVDNDEGATAFYAVRVSERGFISVKVFSSDERLPLAWKQALPVLRKIEADVVAAGQRFARETVHCYMCNRRLTTEESRERGVGPECAKRL